MSRASVRIAAGLAGLLLIALVLRSLDARQIEIALAEVAPWLPLVVALEIGIALTDVMAARVLVGDSVGKIARRTWLRSSALAYATAAILPAGRAAGEAARASVLKDDIGLGRAADAGARLQTASLIGTAFISVVGALAAMGRSSALALSLAGNSVLCGILAATLLSAIRWERLRRWLKADHPSGARIETAHASLWCGLGRVIQAVQYGVVLVAVGGIASVRGALLVQGVHIVGATVGDVVPNQLGVTEGAYRVFADTVGLGAAPARAVTIALTVRVAQLGLAALAWPIALWRPRPRVVT